MCGEGDGEHSTRAILRGCVGANTDRAVQDGQAYGGAAGTNSAVSARVSTSTVSGTANGGSRKGVGAGHQRQRRHICVAIVDGTKGRWRIGRGHQEVEIGSKQPVRSQAGQYGASSLLV